MDTQLDNRTPAQLYTGWTDSPKYILAQQSTDSKFLTKADAIGDPQDLYVWIKTFPKKRGVLFVDAPEWMLVKMRALRSDLQIVPLPES